MDKKDFYSIPSEKVKADISKQLTIAGQYLPTLKKALDKKGEIIPILHSEEIINLLSGGADIFDILGIEIIFPKELKKLASPQVSLSGKLTTSSEGNSLLNIWDMLDFSYEVSIGDQKISVKEFKKLVKSTKGLIKYKDQYLMLKPDEVQNILKKLNEPIPDIKSPMEAAYTAISGAVDGMAFNPDDALKKVIENMTKVEEIDTPASLNAKLRPYQERGFKWLYTNTKKGFGSCIADDMGLGST